MRTLLLVSLLGLSACSGPRNVPFAEWNTPFTLTSAKVDKDSLKVTVQYGGGFRDHSFRLMSDGVATKSLPRQQRVRIDHEGNGDMGRALITEEKAFDLNPLRDPSQGRIVLLLGGWDEPLEYVYLQ